MSTMFEGEQVRLRAYEKEDLNLARQFLNDPQVGEGMRMGILFLLREEDQKKWYDKLDATSQNTYNFAIETIDSKQFIGGCGVHEIDLKNRVAEVGIFLGGPYLGKGLGTDAMSVLIRFCFEEVNLNKIRLYVFSFNERAMHVYEKLGFKVEGTLREEIYRRGKYHDVVMMGLLRREYTGFPYDR